MEDELDDSLDSIEIQSVYVLFPSTRIGFKDHVYCRILCKTGLTYLTELNLKDYKDYNINWTLFNSWN